MRQKAGLAVRGLFFGCRCLGWRLGRRFGVFSILAIFGIGCRCCLSRSFLDDHRNGGQHRVFLAFDDKLHALWQGDVLDVQ